MLEIKDLRKVYVAKGKGGAKTCALDGVSIKFPTTGMVFLLGKSGSGKSTLLNVCGGLDTPTSGEIIVKGRSSKDFSKADFDSYRNTFIGFIFQEYNILNEFTVEDNIALALELQGKKKDKAKIKQLLDDVDLGNFAKRKPNTLSGGQKQRIAIARALIKEPEIIMADEPTGALDSNTGKQVLDTLKKLSKTKLVIVVSHDRDFAEYYGDRIIELKDGKVLSDISKTHTNPIESGNITIVDQENLIIKSGAELKASDLTTLNNFLKNTKKEIFISKGEEEISKYKTIAQISNDGSRDCFIGTDEGKYQKKEYTKDDSKFIKSKLPAHHAFKIGLSNLKLKPLRLFFTEILTIGSLVLLGMFSTMMFYNKTAVAINSLGDGNDYFSLKKVYRVTEKYDDYSYESNYGTKFKDSDIKKLKEDYDEVIPYYSFNFGNESQNYSNLQIQNSGQNASQYYFSLFSGFAYVEDNSKIRTYITQGDYPTKDNEVMIPQYVYESLKFNTLKDEENNNIDISTPDKIIGKEVTFSNIRDFSLKITGIYDIPNIIPEKYKDLLTTQDKGELSWQWQQEVQNSIATLGLVSKDFYKNNESKVMSNSNIYIEKGYYAKSLEIKNEDADYPLVYGNRIDEFKNEEIFGWDGTSNNLVKNDQSIYVPIGRSVCFTSLFESYDKKLNPDSNLFTTSVDGETDLYSALDAFFRGYITKRITEEDELGNIIYESYEEVALTKDERMNYLKLSYPLLKDNNILDSLKNMTLYQPDGVLDPKTMNIDGFYFDLYGNGDRILISDANIELYKDKDFYQTQSTKETKYEIDKNSTIDGVILLNPHDDAKLGKLLDSHFEYAADDSKIVINNSTLQTLDMANEMISMFKQIFLYVGIALAAFASLLLFNFISVSITNKKREIGILRAVGARGTDVFKIFFSESFVITLIATVAALVATFFTTGFVNTSLARGLNGISLLVFDWKCWLLVILLALVVMLISTWLPVYFIAKKKPVDSIRSL